MNTDLIKWDEDLAVDSEEEYQAIPNGLKRSQGYSLYFVQCTPFSSEKLIERVKADLHQLTLNFAEHSTELSFESQQADSKKIGVLKFEQPIADGNVFRRIDAFLREHGSEVLFVQGLENSLVEAAETKKRLGWNRERIDKLNWREVPSVLTNLNQQRERFRDTFKTCFVFLLPQYAIDYLVQRSPDFFDWRSGLFTYVSTAKTLAQESQRILTDADYEAYCNWSLEERNQRLLEIQSLVEQPNLDQETKAQLFFEQALIFWASEDSEAEMAAYDQALTVRPNYPEALYNKGIALGNSGRYEEEIAAYDAALAIKPDDHEAINNKGVALRKLDRYEEAIAAYEAFSVIPNYDEALNNKGIALGNFGRYDEAIAAYDAALALKPDDHGALNNKGIALRKSGRYEEAIAAYDAALALKPDQDEALDNKGLVLANLGRYEEAIAAYDAAIKINAEAPKPYYNKACCYGLQGKVEPALEYLQQAIQLSPEEYCELAQTDTDFDVIRNDSRFQALIMVENKVSESKG